MPSARDARNWVAEGGLHGIGTGPYTPFKGTDGDEIDWDAYRSLVRYCIGELHHEMIWLVSGVGEWWSLTLDERKKLAEVGIAEGAFGCAPDGDSGGHGRGLGEGVCRAHPARPRRRRGHLLHSDAAHGGPWWGGILRYMQYVADRTDIAFGHLPLPFVGLPDDPPGRGPGRQRDLGDMRHEGRAHDPGDGQGVPRVGTRALHLGNQQHRLRSRLVAEGHRWCGPAVPGRVPLRKPPKS